MNLKETATIKSENKKMQRFIETLPLVTQQGFSKWAVFTHAWHESGAFKKVIGCYNYWGIKCPRNWEGKVLLIDTHEYIDGVYVPEKDRRFIDFDSALEAMSWYCNFIRRLYPNAYNNRHDPIEYFKGLTNGNLKYATDPSYIPKLTSLYNVLKDDTNICYLLEKV